MRFVVAFVIVILSFHGQISAQERDTLVERIATPDKSKTLPDDTGMQMSPGSVSMPFSTHDFESGSAFQNLALPILNVNLNNGLKIETGSLMGLRSVAGFPFGNNSFGLYRRSVFDVYQGIYGIRTFQLNNKLSVGTVGYSGRSVNEYLLKSGIYRQTNYGSSLFVGYKFSDKFSISASFTIRRNGDPFNRNQGMLNGSVFP